MSLGDGLAFEGAGGEHGGIAEFGSPAAALLRAGDSAVSAATAAGDRAHWHLHSHSVLFPGRRGGATSWQS